MKKIILALGVICSLTFQSCLKEYNCVCAGTNVGTMKAATKTEANRGCRVLGGSDICTAEK